MRAVWLTVQHGKTPLHHAVEGGHTAAMECLVGHGANMDVKDNVRRAAEVLCMRVCVTGLGLDELLAWLDVLSV